jgi:hypothetical protein
MLILKYYRRQTDIVPFLSINSSPKCINIFSKAIDILIDWSEENSVVIITDVNLHLSYFKAYWCRRSLASTDSRIKY